MKAKLLLGATAAAILLSGGILAEAKTKPQITMEQAQAIALKKIDGTIEQADLVKERRGKEAYSIFVQQADGVTTHEVISARTGKIIRLADETPATAKIR